MPMVMFEPSIMSYELPQVARMRVPLVVWSDYTTLTLTKAISRKDAKGAKAQRACKRIPRC